MIKDKIIEYCNFLGLDTIGFIPCRNFEELVELYKYRKENNLENEFEEKEIEKRINPRIYMKDGKTIISIALVIISDLKELKLATIILVILLASFISAS